MKRAILLYIILLVFAILTKFNTIFYYGLYVTLLSPLLFLDYKRLGFLEFKKGIVWGVLSSLIYVPFILWKSKFLSLEMLNQIPQIFAEEIFFRAFFLEELSASLKNFHMANIITSFLFMLPHLIINPSILSVLVFFPSLIFGYLFYYSRSIYAPVIFHYLSNIFFQTFLIHSGLLEFFKF